MEQIFHDPSLLITTWQHLSLHASWKDTQPRAARLVAHSSPACVGPSPSSVPDSALWHAPAT
eukprot:scaffold5318_cov162-Pinguiococcus_pyrenoidosus.AAC.1